MGKYMKKSKAAGDVAAVITEATLNSSSLGVRTRARAAAAAAALHKLPPPSSPQIPDASYLQLRSRRLLKLPPPPPRAADQPRRCCKSPRKTASFSMSGGEDVDVGSYGENFLEVEARDSSTRESTPCSFIRDSNANHTPGSTTKQQRTRQIIHGHMQRSIPTAYEMEEFFAYAEKQQQTTFIDNVIHIFSTLATLMQMMTSCQHLHQSCKGEEEMYNFDVVNDVPLPGRYEWVPVLN